VVSQSLRVKDCLNFIVSGDLRQPYVKLSADVGAVIFIMAEQPLAAEMGSAVYSAVAHKGLSGA